jgi:predicted MFS family arabinose efflux permease
MTSQTELAHASAADEWRAGAGVLIAAMICHACTSLPVSIIGILVKPLGTEFGWSRSIVSASILITTLGTLFFAPVVGQVVARAGLRRVGLAGLVAVGVASVLIGLSGPSSMTWYVAWGLYALAQVVGGPVIWSTAVVTRFARSRGLALSVLLSAQALTFGFMPALGVLVVSSFGWRVLFFGFSAATLLLALPLALLFLYGSTDIEKARGGPRPAADPQKDKATDRAVFRTRQFWQIVIAFAIAPATISALFVHLQPIITDAGISAVHAAAIIAVYGPTAIFARFAVGVLLDRFATNVVGALCLLLPAVSYAIFILAGVTIDSAYAVSALLGLSAGVTSNLVNYLPSRYFGPELFSRIFGIVLGIYALGYGASPFIAGAIYDALRTYGPLYIILLVGSLVAATLVVMLGSPPPAGDNPRQKFGH